MSAVNLIILYKEIIELLNAFIQVLNWMDASVGLAASQ